MSDSPGTQRMVDVLRNYVKCYVTQHPDTKWGPLKTHLERVEDGAFSTSFIDKHGVDMYNEESRKHRRRTHSKQHMGALSPPGDCSNSSDPEDTDLMPKLVGSAVPYTVDTVICNPATGEEFPGPMSLKYCAGRINFISLNTLRGRQLDKYVDKRTNTLLLKWCANSESRCHLGAAPHTTRCVVVEKMNADVAIANEEEEEDQEGFTGVSAISELAWDPEEMELLVDMLLCASRKKAQQLRKPGKSARMRDSVDSDDDYDSGPVNKKRRD